MLHDDIEASLVNFDDDFSLEEDDDYNHIPPTPIESDDDDDDDTIRRHDFALAARTSDIISSYRDFLNNMDEEANNDEDTTTVNSSSTLSSTYDIEQISAKNIQLTNEMASLRASLGRDMQKNLKKKKRSSLGSRANIHIYEESCLQSGVHDESNSTKYSLPLLHSNVIKKRLLSAATIIFVVGVGVMLVTTEISKHSNDRQDNFNLPDWNEELNDVHLEEVEKQKGTSLNVNHLASSKWHARVSGSVNTNTKEESEAKQMIEEIIHHPEDVHIVEPLRGSKQGKSVTASPELYNKSSTVKKTSTKSSKSSATKSNKTLGKSNKKSTTTKSGKAPSSKSAKSNSSDESHIQVAPVQGSIEPRSNDPAAVATTTSSTLASFSILDFSSEKSNRNSELPTTQEEEEILEEAKDIVKRERLHLESAHILYQTISRKYNPLFYSREKGEYGGHTFTDAMSFCQENYPKSEDGKVGVPCGYQVYCPEGPNTVPYGGYVTNEISTGDGGTYAPIISFEENWIGWVQLSEGHSCNEYPVLEPEPTIEQTCHIMCCKDVN